MLSNYYWTNTLPYKVNILKYDFFWFKKKHQLFLSPPPLKPKAFKNNKQQLQMFIYEKCFLSKLNERERIRERTGNF